jgi:DNA replication protein
MTMPCVLLHLPLEREGEPEDVYFVNTEANREVIARVENGELSLGALPRTQPYVKEERPNIFTLYEQNIGLLTPMIAEELKEAEEMYPAPWIEDAFREAVSLNKRSWRYIARILQRWSSEGKESGESRRDSKKKRDPDRYVKGKYGHLVER